MNCPSCGAPMRLDAGAESLTCAYCHSVYLPEKNDDDVRVLGAPGEEMCPGCAVGLVEASFASVRMQYCTRCRGMLIAMDAFAALVQELRQGHEGGVIRQAPDRTELERRLTCPHCRQAMETHFYAGPGNVILSDCERCSLDWVNHAKMLQIAHAPDALRETDEELV
ncbi:MAG TPA: zf-TFIIB domain-containing protein [Acidobacteriaceae bacterium]|nr:zf-TFIIB domain-containing protein [Acidobacteriaceae bacterium]